MAKKSSWFEFVVGGGRDGVLVEVETAVEGLLGQTTHAGFPRTDHAFPSAYQRLLRVCKRTLDRDWLIQTGRLACVDLYEFSAGSSSSVA